MHSDLYPTSARVVWTADTRSNVDLNRRSAPVLLADLGKHVVKHRRIHERSEGYRLTWRFGVIG